MPDERPTSYPSNEEVDLALRRCWQPVARVEELREGPKRAVLLNEALSVFLTKGGEPGVVADRCGHRGASLSRGEVCGDSLQCPYHGWEWGTDGACTRIPSLPDQRQIPPGAQIEAFPVRVQWGLVWTTLEDPLGEPPSVPWFDAGTWRWRHGAPFELPVGFGVMIENFRDVAHFAFVHEDSFGPMEEVIEPLDPREDGLEVTLRWKMSVGKDAKRLWGATDEVCYHAIAPNFTSVQMLTERGERCLLHAARAISPTESAHYWIKGLGKGYEEDSLEEAIAFEQRVYDEDIPIVSTVEPRELALDPSTELSTLSDRFTLAYRRAFLAFVRQAGDGSAQRDARTS